MVKNLEKSAVKKYKFNINKYVYVKLTEFGKQKALEKYGPEYNQTCIEGHRQPNGYYKFQMHEVLATWGEYCVVWARPEELPFSTDIYFTDEDIEVVDYEEQE
jgi:hypothetical protein